MTNPRSAPTHDTASADAVPVGGANGAAQVPDETVVATFYRTVSVERTAQETGLPTDSVRRVLNALVPDFPVLAAAKTPTRGRRYSDEELATSLQEAAGPSGRITFAKYEKFVRDNPLLADGKDRPGGQVMHLRFGSWNAALQAAGLATAKEGRRGGPARSFDEAAVVAAVTECWRDLAAPPTAAGYDAWQKAQRAADPGLKLPSTATSRKVGGSWTAVLVNAWQEVHGIRLG